MNKRTIKDLISDFRVKLDDLEQELEKEEKNEETEKTQLEELKAFFVVNDQYTIIEKHSGIRFLSHHICDIKDVLPDAVKTTSDGVNETFYMRCDDTIFIFSKNYGGTYWTFNGSEPCYDVPQASLAYTVHFDGLEYAEIYPNSLATDPCQFHIHTLNYSEANGKLCMQLQGKFGWHIYVYNKETKKWLFKYIQNYTTEEARIYTETD